MDATAGLDARLLAPPIGVETTGLDLRERQPERTIQRLRRARHHVLVFHGQDLADRQQWEFVSRFGELGRRKQAPTCLGNRVKGGERRDTGFVLVLNITADGKPIDSFGDGKMWPSHRFGIRRATVLHCAPRSGAAVPRRLHAVYRHARRLLRAVRPAEAAARRTQGAPCSRAAQEGRHFGRPRRQAPLAGYSSPTRKPAENPCSSTGVSKPECRRERRDSRTAVLPVRCGERRSLCENEW